MINTNLPPILCRFRDIAFNRSKIAIFRYPYLVFNPADGAVPYIISPEVIYRQKLHALGYIPVAECLGISSMTFTQCATKTTEFGEITQNKGHYAVQGHSRSPILVPIESSYTTSY